MTVELVCRGHICRSTEPAQIVTEREHQHRRHDHRTGTNSSSNSPDVSAGLGTTSTM